jgi:hypothetical protein
MNLQANSTWLSYQVQTEVYGNLMYTQYVSEFIICYRNYKVFFTKWTLR